MVIALVAGGSVLAMFLYNLGIERYGDEATTAWAMARFFTILTNLAVAWTFANAARCEAGPGTCMGITCQRLRACLM